VGLFSPTIPKKVFIWDNISTPNMRRKESKLREQRQEANNPSLKENPKMADDKLSTVSKQQLAEAYAKLKSRTDKMRNMAKDEGEALVRDVITIGSGFGVGYYMGMQYGEATKEGETEEKIKEAGQIAGIDFDLMVGGGLAALGLMKMAGKQSDTIRAAGIGALSAWAGRTGQEKGLESVLKEDED
jgi:hypothetical protein